MTSLNYSLLIIFGVIGYMMIVDSNVSEYFTLVFKLIKINIERYCWMIRFHPKNPITNLIMRWKYAKIAKDLQKQFENKADELD